MTVIAWVNSSPKVSSDQPKGILLSCYRILKIYIYPMEFLLLAYLPDVFSQA